MDASIWILLLSFITSAATASGCEFPLKWRGRWYQDTFGELRIRAHEITRKGRCAKNQGNKYLIEDSNSNCYRCLVFTYRPDNILQYKESFCFARNSIQTTCNEINGDAPLHTIVRVHSVPVPCPFQGYYSFTYSNSTTTASKHCKYPFSEILPCADDSKFKFAYRHCRNMPETFDKELNFQCLAKWEDGEKYLYGKFSSPRKSESSPMFRCFMHGLYGMSGDMSMTADATCLGLQSPSVGFSTMKLTREDIPDAMSQRIKTEPVFYATLVAWLKNQPKCSSSGKHIHNHELDGDMWPSPHCRYPEFFVRRKHWRDMSGRFELEVDDALQIFRVKDKYSREAVSYRERNVERSEMKMVVRCIDIVDESRREIKEYLTHVTDDTCFSGYRCLRLVKRDRKVLELYISANLGSRNTACSAASFQRGEKHLLIPTNIRPSECPTHGAFLFMDKTSDCSGNIKFGCGDNSDMVVEKKCHHKQSADYMSCLLTFHEKGTHYVIVQKTGSVRGEASCLALRDTEGGLDVREDFECSSKRMVVRNRSMHYVLFTPGESCPRVYTPPPPVDPPNRESPDVSVGDNSHTQQNDGTNSRPNDQHFSSSKNGDMSSNVINVDNGSHVPRTSCILLCVCLLLTLYSASSQR